MCYHYEDRPIQPTKLPAPFKMDREEIQILNCITCFLWDYLRKSGATGFMLPLSGGADSGLTAAIFYYFANRLLQYLHRKGPQIRTEILDQLRTIFRDDKFDPYTPEEITSRMLFTRYMGTNNSSKESRERATQLAE